MASLLDQFRGLSASARALLPFFTQQAATDKSANQILADLKAEGRGIRRQTGLDIIGALRDNLTKGAAARFAAPDQLLTPDLLPTSITPTKRDFSHQTIVRMVDPKTGERINQEIVVSTDEILTPDLIKDKASSLALSGRYGSGLEIEDIELKSSQKSIALEL